jgi:hypothetical protein
MSNEDARATGAEDALLGDLLLELGVPNPIARSREQRLATIQAAIEDGRLPSEHVAMLRRLGILPPRVKLTHYHRDAQLDADLAAAPSEELSQEAIADKYKITLNQASTLMSEYEHQHPGSKGIRQIRYVRRARRGDARL